MPSADCLVVGAGVVGLSLAYELSGQGIRVEVLERGTAGREASWAGAGILPAASDRPGDPPYDRLSGLSVRLHAQWSRRLADQTRIDNGYRRCGGLYVARSDSETAALNDEMAALGGRGVTLIPLNAAQLASREPALAGLTKGPLQACFHVPEVAQLRNPRHLQALITACRQRGVRFIEHASAQRMDVQNGRLRQLHTSAGLLRAEQYCFTTGAWTSKLLEQLGCQLPIKPIRGQMVLLKLPEQRLRSIVHLGQAYLVPRDDGRILVGSTMEDVGFDKRTTARTISDLLNFATSIMPELAEADVEQCWAGLRPSSPEGMPYLGAVPGLENAYVAAGHFRWGLYLSPATAVLLTELMRGVPPQIDLEAFRLDRD
ncbi:MAG: glycine oxidase ThiO [Planctomycetales bacterium]|nr:glycine oxidase ThiO [Planctomycetales bacterium]NIM07942.1 glycine oxidase ThiO [Planctomycetales bacterium]NIN07421.1 glycine oxidase ThiO [Planctomycetales bacterium]NIN76525.1 glycine oxidase ThiO [Planctomycetales bacterium]NIO45520.1 glycine oxidase ThiO [Planctomycetales bacterium]